MNLKVYLNGQIVDHEKAMISVTDAGFQHAVGLFETMSVYRRKVFRLKEHLLRIQRSAGDLGLAHSLDINELRRAVEATVTANDLEQARVRLTVTPGSVPLMPSSPHDQIVPKSTVLVVATHPTQYDPAYFENGITVLIAAAGANPFDAIAGHKTLAYWGRLRTLRQAAAAGAGEAIWLNVTNHLASGAVSNLFLVNDGQLWTPIARGEEQRVLESMEGSTDESNTTQETVADQGMILPAPVLPGITRAAVLELATSLGISVQRRMLSVEDLLGAQEVFLTNSSWMILPVTRVEKHVVGDGKVGPVTQLIRSALLELIDRETAVSVMDRD